MSQTPRGQDSESLSYELLLRKSCDAGPAAEPVSDDASTVEPLGSSSASSAGSAAVVPALGKDGMTLIRNVTFLGPNADKALAGIIAQTRELSKKVFEEDCLLEVTKKSGWKLSLLVSKDFTVLGGFIISKVAQGNLSIAKIAVPAQFRGRGFGRLIMDETLKAAKKQGEVSNVCLSSLPTAVSFYRRLGFKAHKDLKIPPEDGTELVEGQVYMEKRLQKRRR